MNRDEAISILLDHLSAGLVRTLEDAIAKEEREECAKICESLELPEYPNNIRVPLAKAIRARGQE